MIGTYIIEQLAKGTNSQQGAIGFVLKYCLNLAVELTAGRADAVGIDLQHLPRVLDIIPMGGLGESVGEGAAGFIFDDGVFAGKHRFFVFFGIELLL
jgi:hypothetical protein